MREEADAVAGDEPRQSTSIEPGDGNRLKDQLWRFRNTFTAEVAAEIKRIIDEDCERIEDDES